MPRERLSMRKVREVLRLKAQGLSHRAIGASCSLDAGTICELYHEFISACDPRMRQVHKAGEKLFVDYAGQTMPVVDPATGEVRQAQIFVATLSVSDYTFAEATFSQSLEDWIGSHVRPSLSSAGYRRSSSGITSRAA